MIIVDLSQVTYSTLMIQLGFDTTKLTEVNEDILRHMVLNCIRSYNMKYKNEYGKMYIACDDTSWRKDKFPYYKANRKKARDKSEYDWESLFQSINKIRDELRVNLPYIVIHSEKTEADDIISYLVSSSNEPCLILSGDKDFIQLHKHPNVKQYDPTRKKWVTHDNPELYLFEHILKGDPGDGVPNVLSSDNCLVIGERQKALTQKRLNAFHTSFKEVMTNPMIERNYYRNKELIDLSQTPDYIINNIVKEIENQTNKPKVQLLDYFIKHRLKELTTHLSDF